MSKTILLADDSVTIQKVVELTFMDQDYQVIAVSDGKEALERLTESRPDLVIADVHMPEVNGYEVCRQTKESHPGLPVLLLVGTFETFDLQQANAAGADGHLKKPFESQALLKEVDDLISQSAAAPAAAPAQEAPTQSAEPAAAPSPPEPAAPQPAAPQPAAPQPAAPQPAAPTPQPSPPEPPTSQAPSPQPPAPQQAAPLPPTPQLATPETAPTPPVSKPELPQALETEFLAAPSVTPGEASPSFTTRPTAPRPDLSAPEMIPPTPAAETAPPEPEPAPPEPEPTPPPKPAERPAAAVAAGNGGGPLSDEDVDRIARRLVELLGDNILREVAWEVVPDLAEVVIKERINELESQVE